MRISHGACGKTWEQKGNKSGHCSDCHEVFYGLSAFDKHRKEMTCRDPLTLKGEWWQDEDQQWHCGRRLSEAEKKEIWG